MSIRDQIYRGYSLVRRALDRGLLVPDARCTDLTGANNQRILAGNPFNVVIARHGVDPAQPPLGAAPSAAPYRQVIPYSSVW